MTIRTLFSALLFTLPPLIGCMREPELKADFGPEVSPASFREKLAQIEVPDPYSIKKNEYAYFVRSTIIQDQIYQLDRRWAYTVTDMKELPSDYKITYVKELREYDQGHEKISQNQADILLSKKKATTVDFSPVEMIVALYSGKPRALSFSTQSASFASGYLRGYGGSITTRENGNRVSFHNLKLEKASIPVPDFVQQRANCGGLSPEKCRGPLKAYVLSFDQVVWKGRDGQRYSVLWVFSPDMPVFGSSMFPDTLGVIKSCGTTQLPYQGQRIKVTQCDEIKDFTFGHD